MLRRRRVFSRGFFVSEFVDVFLAHLEITQCQANLILLTSIFAPYDGPHSNTCVGFVTFVEFCLSIGRGHSARMSIFQSQGRCGSAQMSTKASVQHSADELHNGVGDNRRRGSGCAESFPSKTLGVRGGRTMPRPQGCGYGGRRGASGSQNPGRTASARSFSAAMR
jgi:hypothetical protein